MTDLLKKKEVIAFIFDSLGIDKKIITLPESTRELIAPRKSDRSHVVL